MNHAFVDASWNEQPDGSGLGGWGLVLLRPGHLPERYQGQLDSPDNNAAELRAVLEAVRLAPAGELLAVYTDNQAVIATLARGRGPELLQDPAREVHEEAAARQVGLRVGYVPRTRRHLRAAHDLANDARRGSSPDTRVAGAEVLIEQRAGQHEARVTLRRSNGQRTERVTAHVQDDPLSDMPPSARALLTAVTLAQPGETLHVRRASKVAQALWQRPERALRPAVQAELNRARAEADGAGVQVVFTA